MATRKNGNVAATGESKYSPDQIVNIPIADIDLNYDNSRFGDFTVAESRGDGKDQSFAELKESISINGQKDPVVLRPLNRGKGGKKLQLIVGFRRYAAVKELAVAAGNVKTATIRAVIEDHDDLSARVRNTLENTARDNLSTQDVAYAAYRISSEHQRAGREL